MHALLPLLFATILAANLFAPRAPFVVVLDVLAITILVVVAAMSANGEG